MNQGGAIANFELRIGRTQQIGHGGKGEPALDPTPGVGLGGASEVAGVGPGHPVLKHESPRNLLLRRPSCLFSMAPRAGLEPAA